MNPLSTGRVEIFHRVVGGELIVTNGEIGPTCGRRAAMGLASCAAVGRLLLARSIASPPLPRRSTALRRENEADPDEVGSKNATFFMP